MSQTFVLYQNVQTIKISTKTSFLENVRAAHKLSPIYDSIAEFLNSISNGRKNPFGHPFHPLHIF